MADLSVEAVQQAFQQWLSSIFGNEAKALEFAEDPYGELEQAGFNNPAQLNVQQAVNGICADPDTAPHVKEHLQDYTPPTYPGPPTIEHVVHQVQQVTQIVYEDNDVINQEIQNNSTNVNVGDNFSGEIDVDNVNNSGDEAAIATGDGFSGQQNTGDGAVQNQNSTVDGPIVTGPNSGVIADGNVENAVTGGSTVGAQVQDGSTVSDLQFATGSGPINQTDDSPFSATSAGGDAQNNPNINVVANSEDVNTEQGPGDQAVTLPPPHHEEEKEEEKQEEDEAPSFL